HREPISAGIELQETIMLRLRLLLQGLQLEDIQKEFGVDLTCTRGREIRSLVDSGLLRSAGGSLYLEESAAMLGNEAWQALM
ncbi:MAG: hypothetical protein ACRDFX_12850, partial [Chloroflexota bacterium]